MKRFLGIIFLVIVVVFAWRYFSKKGGSAKEKDPDPVAIKAGKHSQSFNATVASAISNYMLMKDAFVNDDSATAQKQAGEFIKSINALPLDELISNGDSTIKTTAQQQLSDIKSNTAPIASGESLQEMRHDFYMVSENLYPFLKIIGYEGEKLYWQNCPMAFGDNQSADWLSNTREIMNPYLGKKHPIYKSGMLHCGETKDSIFTK